MMTHREAEVQLHSQFTSALHPIQHCGKTPIHIEKGGCMVPQSQSGYFGEEKISLTAARKQALDPPA
jgi:hypothetical protein